MKDVWMLLGFGVGLVTGTMLYKYSQETKKLVDKGERCVVQKAEELEQKAEKGMQQVTKKMKQGMKKSDAKSKK